MFTLGKRDRGPRADTSRSEDGTAAGSAVGIAETGTSDKLTSLAIADVLRTGGIRGESTASASGSRCAGGRRSRRSSLGRRWRSGGGARSRETATLLTLGKRHRWPRADTTRSENGTAAGSAIGIAETGTGDKLTSLAISNVLGTRGIRSKSTASASGSGRAGRRGSGCSSLGRRRGGGAGVETTACLSLLKSCAWSRADTRGSEGSATGRRAVGVAQACASDKLPSLAISNVLGSRGIRTKGVRVGLGECKNRGGDYASLVTLKVILFPRGVNLRAKVKVKVVKATMLSRVGTGAQKECWCLADTCWRRVDTKRVAQVKKWSNCRMNVKGHLVQRRESG